MRKEMDRGKSQQDLANEPVPAIFAAAVGEDKLPILSIEQELGRHLNAFQTVLIHADTATGKSTQLPQMLRRLGWCQHGFQIAIVQPNHLTAMRLVQRLEMEMNQADLVRLCTNLNILPPCLSTHMFTIFDQASFLRYGFGMDPKLAEYSLVFLDEVHERLLDMDIACGLLMRLQSTVRTDLRLLLASATMDCSTLLRYFPQSSLVTCDDECKRRFPINIAYLTEPCPHYLNACIDTVTSIHKTDKQQIGDVLVFVPTREECEYVVRRLQDDNYGLLCLPLHEAMSVEEQRLVVTSVARGKRKVICCTPTLCETSITIPNIVYVVDSMFAQQVDFQPETGVHKLSTRPVSKARADQRAGRTGRQLPGKCFRLCTEPDFYRLLPKHNEPEILRTDLVDTVLLLKSFGMDHFASDFPFITIPRKESLVVALDLLFALGAIDENAEITAEGRMLVQLPVSVRLGKVLLCASNSTVKDAGIDLVALIASGVGASLLSQSAQGSITRCAAKEGDHFTMLNLLGQVGYKNHDQHTKFVSFQQCLKRHLHNMDLSIVKQPGASGNAALMECVLSGFFSQIAQLKPNGLYSTARDGQQVELHSSCVFTKFGKLPEWICFHEAVLLSDLHKPHVTTTSMVRIVSSVDPRTVLRVAPHFWKVK